MPRMQVSFAIQSAVLIALFSSLLRMILNGAFLGGEANLNMMVLLCFTKLRHVLRVN